MKIPVFTGTAIADQINTRVRASADYLLDAVRKNAESDEPGDSRDVTGDFDVTTNDGRTTQIVITAVDYLQGTAHPNNSVATTVIDNQGGPVTLDEVFIDTTSAITTLRPVIRDLANKAKQPVDDTSDGLAPTISNWGAWQTSEAGMVFFFQDYQLGGHGLRSYTVPWKTVRPLMSQSARKLLDPDAVCPANAGSGAGSADGVTTRKISSADYYHFHSPSNNIYCALNEKYARCEIQRKTWKAPSRPRDCMSDWGYGLVMSDGDAGILCAGDSEVDPNGLELLYDHAVDNGKVRCTSRSTGMTCEDLRTGHSFTLSRSSYTLTN